MFGKTLFILFSAMKLIVRKTEFVVNASLSKFLDRKLVDQKVPH